MEIARSFLVTVTVWILFAAGAAMYLLGEQQAKELATDWSRPQLFEGAYAGESDPAEISGEQALGLVAHAKAGQFVLTLDGLLIDARTDLSAIDFRGVPGANYTLAVTRDSTGGIVSIKASQ